MKRNMLYFFVIDTDTYSGDFERQLTAFCTGHIGDCGVGEEEARQCHEAHPHLYNQLQDLMTQIPDDHGCYRPCVILPTPGWWNDGYGHHWRDDAWESPEAIRAYECACATTYCPEGWPPPRLTRHPAYQSVGIAFQCVPSWHIIQLLMQRAQMYKHAEYPFSITGFRLMRRQTLDTDVCTYPM